MDTRVPFKAMQLWLNKVKLNILFLSLGMFIGSLLVDMQSLVSFPLPNLLFLMNLLMNSTGLGKLILFKLGIRN